MQITWTIILAKSLQDSLLIVNRQLHFRTTIYEYYSYCLIDLNEAIAFYSDDLSNPSILEEELCGWKTKWLIVKQLRSFRKNMDTLKQCCPASLPNIFILLKLFGIIPLSSCASERSASALSDLTIICNRQPEEQLSAITLIHMSYKYDINIDIYVSFFRKIFMWYGKTVYLLLNFL